MRDGAGQRSEPGHDDPPAPDGSGQARSGQGRAVVAVLRRGELFLVHRRAAGVTMPGYWSPLSGGLEPGETQAEAVVREVREEVGLTVRARRRVWECDTHDGAYRLYWWVVEEAAPGAEPRPDPAEVAELRWVTVHEFGRLSPTFVDDRYFFRAIAATT